MKKFSSLGIMLLASLMLMVAFSTSVKAETQTATIWTDKEDYAPEETVTIFGSGFNTLSNVEITVERPNGTNDTISAVTDDVGNFTCTYLLDGITGTYTVNATDGTNAATTTFTDAIYNLRIWADVGAYVGPNPDPWIEGDWVVSREISAGQSVNFELYIDAVGANPTYNMVLAIAVNDTAQIDSVTVGSTTVTTFTYGLVTWPMASGGGSLASHSIYPTSYALASFGDVASNFGYYTTPGAPYSPLWSYRAHLPVTITTKNTMNAGFKVHFDAQGVLAGGIGNTNSLAHDLTFTGILPAQYYLQVTSPYGTPSGEGWKTAGSYAEASLETDIVDGDSGVRYVFTGWSGDAQGTGLTSDPILMSGPRTAVANWKTQYLVTFAQTGLDNSATGTVVTITVGEGLSLSMGYGSLSFATWVDSGTSISYTYNSAVPSTPGNQFWLSSVTGPMSPLIVGSPVTVTGNYLLLPYSQVTNGMLGNLDFDSGIVGQQFRIIFTQNVTNPGTYKLPATNPGQFYYNVFHIGTPGSTATFTITLPNRFVTQGAVPVHVYGSVNIVGGCFVPFGELTGFTITRNAGIITVEGTVPSSGLVYVTVHLDYSLKGTFGYTKNSNNDALLGSVVAIPNLGSYTFSVSGALSSSQTIQNENVFKRDPGFAGIVTDSQGNPVAGVKVQIYLQSGKLLATVYTDMDGFYSYAYKHTGKTATFTIKLPEYNITRSVTVKANALVEANFKI